ncbi:MAG: 4Fe-4S binding protein [Candidatus Bathyarchaeia archaeon]
MDKIIVDLDMCTGCGTCVEICPEQVFKPVEKDGMKVSEAIAKADCFACRAYIKRKRRKGEHRRST